MNDSVRRGRRQFLLLAAFFLGPLALAFVIYYGFDWRPAGSTEHGELLRPPLSLPDLAIGPEHDGTVPRLRHRWSLLVIEREGCPETCQLVLYKTRQVRTALARERDRTQRVLRVTGDFDRPLIELQHPDLVIVTDQDAAAAELDASLGELETDFVYVVDPLGNLMMRFPRDTAMKAIHTDLKKLLRLSRIG